jgi:hypothetical protein
MLVIHLGAIEEQHVKMHIEIDRTTETLNQGNYTGVCSDPSKLNQIDTRLNIRQQ